MGSFMENMPSTRNDRQKRAEAPISEDCKHFFDDVYPKLLGNTSPKYRVQDCCSEPQFKCSDTGSLIEVNLGKQNLKGYIPQIRLNSLQYLIIPENQLTGKIPNQLGELKNLTILDLMHNRLEGTLPPILFQSLTKLSVLAVSNNSLTGVIPSQIGNLASLNYIGMNNNNFTGQLPTELGNLSNLQQIYIGKNQLEGPVPSGLWKLKSLESMGLYSNKLTGQIPPEINQLKSIKLLWLEDNSFSGPIPTTIGDLNQLNDLYLGDNLNGTIPKEIAKLKELTNLNVTGNFIGGIDGVPQEIKEMKNYNNFRINLKTTQSTPTPTTTSLTPTTTPNTSGGGGDLPLETVFLGCFAILALVIVGYFMFNRNRNQKQTDGFQKPRPEEFRDTTLPKDAMQRIENGPIENRSSEHNYTNDSSKYSVNVSSNDLERQVSYPSSSNTANGERVASLYDMSGIQSVLFDSRLMIKKQMAGAGGSGQVYKAVYGGKHAVAKIPKLAEHEHLIYEESQMLEKLQSPYVVKVLQLMSNARIPIPGQDYIPQTALLIEYMNYGTLAQYLKTEPPTFRIANYSLEQYSLVLSQTLELTKMAAKGLEYIHSMGYNHLDIKPDNILLHQHSDRTLIAKISDFGSAREEGSSDAVFQTMGYVPPESFSDVDGKLPTKTSKYDIYAFGGCLINIITLENYVSLWSGLYKSANDVEKFLSAHISNPSVVQLIMDCRNDQPYLRPTATELLRVLETIDQASFQVTRKAPTYSKFVSRLPTNQKQGSESMSNISGFTGQSSIIYKYTPGKYLFQQLNLKSPCKWTEFIQAFETEFDLDADFDRVWLKDLVKPVANRVTAKAFDKYVFPHLESLEHGDNEEEWIDCWYDIMHDMILDHSIGN